jgi:hypothetical protein
MSFSVMAVVTVDPLLYPASSKPMSNGLFEAYLESVGGIIEYLLFSQIEDYLTNGKKLLEFEGLASHPNPNY